MRAPYLTPPLARWLGTQRIDFDECESTNDEAARMARGGANHGTVVVAETQRAGRGRGGRVWASPRGRGLYLSAVIRPSLPLSDVPAMTLAIGVGLCDAVRATGADAELKWPNDVLVRDGAGARRKVAGVLVEAQSQGSRLEAVVVGIGVNLGAFAPGEVPADIAVRASTLEEVTREPIDREAFIATLLAHVERWIDRYVAIGISEIVPEWTDRMAHGLTARALVDRSTSSGAGSGVVGVMVGLADDGAVVLRDASGMLHRVRSGDVEMLTPPAPHLASDEDRAPAY